MGQQTRGIYPEKDGTWQVDKWYRHTRLRQRGFPGFEEAERWLIKQLAELRRVVVHGERKVRRFDETAAHYLLTNQSKTSLVTETYLLQSVMPMIGTLELHQVHDGTLAAYVAQRLGDGRSHKTCLLYTSDAADE